MHINIVLYYIHIAVEQKENLAEANRGSAPAYVSSSNPFLHMVKEVDASHEADSQPETANEVGIIVVDLCCLFVSDNFLYCNLMFFVKS